MGIGEALVTALDEKGRPTPLVHCLLRAPQSRMDVLTKSEIDKIIKNSSIIDKYNKEVDRESAYEILGEKIEEAQKKEHQEELKKQKEKAAKSRRKEKTFIEKAAKSTAGREIARTLAREVTRGLLGALGIKSSSRKKSSWF